MPQQFKVGAARRDVTPPVGTELSGFIARLKPSQGVADSLHVRALVVAAEEGAVALVQADLLGFAQWHAAEIREFAWQRLGIPRAAVLLSATHTHSGPGVVQVRGCGVASYAYQREVVEKIQSALQEAHANLLPASMDLGSMPYQLGINRRQETSTGVVLGFAPEKPGPKRLEVAHFATTKQEALLFSHACHPYVLGGDSLLISGDFASQASAKLENDGRTLAFFLNGCAGNIAPQAAFQGIEKTGAEGERLAEALRQASSRLSSAEDTTLLAADALVHLPYRPLPTEQEIKDIVAQQERVVRPEEKPNPQIQARIRGALEEWRALMMSVVRGRLPLAPVHCEVQAVRLGPLLLLGISGEPFFEIGERIRAASRHPWTWPLGYTNAYCGYIPTRLEYGRGGYEVDESWKYVGVWKIDESCEERVVEAATALLTRVS